jgi:hypothetical protein
MPGRRSQPDRVHERRPAAACRMGAASRCGRYREIFGEAREFQTDYYMAIRRIMYRGLYAAPDRAALPRLRRSPRRTALSRVRLRSIRIPHALGARA